MCASASCTTARDASDTATGSDPTAGDDSEIAPATDPSTEPIVLTLPTELTIQELPVWLDARLTDAGVTEPECFVLWGDLGPRRNDGPAIRIRYSGGRIDGVVACGAAAAAALSDERMRQVAMLGWQNGRVRGAHPSDTSESHVLDAPDDAMRAEAAAQPTVGLFAAEGHDSGSATAVLQEIERVASPIMLFIALPVR